MPGIDDKPDKSIPAVQKKTPRAGSNDPTPAQRLADARQAAAEAEAELRQAEDDEVVAKREEVPAFDPEAPTILLEDGTIIEAPLGTNQRDPQVRIGHKVYDHVADFNGGAGDDRWYRWVYRWHP